MSAIARHTSPAIAALASRLAAGDRAALDAFWQEVAARGTPLIEPLDGDATHMLVTFLWRGPETLQNVVIVDGVAGENFAANQMAHLPGTDVWHRSYRVRNDTRTVYSFSPDDPLPEEGAPGWVEHYTAEFRSDPLNPVVAFGEESVLALPAAPPEEWIAPRPDVPAGAASEHCLRSEILGNERAVIVHTPPGYQAGAGPYGLLLLFDGGAYAAMPAPVMLDNLLAAGRIPPLVAALVDSLPGARTEELTCNPRFDDFVVRELLPWLRARYALSDDPRQAIIGGFSYGALAAAFSALRHPDLFGSVLSQSGTFWWLPGYDYRRVAPEDGEPGWLIREYVQAPRLPLRFHLDVGLLETDVKPGGVGTSTLNANRHMRDVLAAKGYAVHYAEFSGGHDLLGWRGALPEALAALGARASYPPHADLARRPAGVL